MGFVRGDCFNRLFRKGASMKDNFFLQGDEHLGCTVVCPLEDKPSRPLFLFDVDLVLLVLRSVAVGVMKRKRTV